GVVVGAERAAPTWFTQPSRSVSRAAAGVVLEQSVAEASLAIAASNLLSASARHAVGSISLVACFDRQRSLADAFLAAAVTFCESHLLSAGVLWLAPTAARTLLSHVAIAEMTAPALPGHETLRSAFVKSFVTVSSGVWSHGAAGALPFASALESHRSVLEIASPDDLSLLPSHLSARAIAGCRSDAVARIRTNEYRRECMSGWPPQVAARARRAWRTLTE